MHGEEHLGHRFLLQGGVDTNHSLFDDVGGAPLNWRVESHAFPQRPQPKVARAELRQVAASTKHRRRETVDLRFFHLSREKRLHFWELSIVSFDKIRRLIYLDAKPLRNSKSGHPVSDPVRELLDMVPHLRRDIGEGDTINLGGDGRMEVVSLGESLEKSLILRKMRQYSELDLRVIRREQHVVRGCTESAPDLAAHLAANRDVLQVRRR